MSSRLTDLEITEVSFVDVPADPNARIELFKRDTTNTEEIVLPSPHVHKSQPSSEDVMEEEVLGSTDSKNRKRKKIEEEEDLGKSVNTSYSSSAGNDTEERLMPEMEFTPEQEEYVRSLEDQIMDAEEVVKALASEIEVLKADEDDSPEMEDILKSAPSEVIELLKAANARAAEAEEVAKAERTARLRREAVEKAADYGKIGVAREELGELLYNAGEVLDNDTMTKLHDVLKTANEAADVAALYGEIGKAGERQLSDGETELDVIAKSIQTRDTVTYEQAYDRAIEENPAVYMKVLGG